MKMKIMYPSVILLASYFVNSLSSDSDDYVPDKLVTACEGDYAYINCTGGNVINIIKVFYGRRDKLTCAMDGSTDNWESGCYSLNALDVVSSRCSGLSECNVTSSNELYTDPCPGIVKYLQLEYNCTNFTTTHTASPPTRTTQRLTPDHTTPTSTTQIESPSIQSNRTCKAKNQDYMAWPDTKAGELARVPCPNKKGYAQWKCSEVTSEWTGFPDYNQCWGAVTNFIYQFDITRRATESELKKLESETVKGDHIKELVDFFIKLNNSMMADLDKLNDLEKEDAVVNIYEAIYGISSFLLSENKMSIWNDDLGSDQRKQLSSHIVSIVERTSFMRAFVNKRPFHNQTAHIGLEMHVFDPRSKTDDLIFHSVSHDWNNNNNNNRNMIKLTGNTVKKMSPNGVAHVLFVSYAHLHELLGPQRNGSSHKSTTNQGEAFIIGSEVISASVNGSSGIELADPVVYTLDHVKGDNFSNVNCSYWEFPNGHHKGRWSTEGCWLVESTLTHTTCACDHMTNFAILMTVSDEARKIINEDVGHSFALSFITYFGCIISIIALLASFLVFTFVRSIQCKRNTIHKNVVICLCISEVIFLIGITPTSKVLCQVVAMCLHFLFLSTFLWMFLEGVQLYVMLVQVFVIKMSRALWYYVFSYGAASIIVIISASVNFNGYGTRDYCWLSIENGFIWAFVGPVCFIIGMNMIFLSMAVFVMCKHTYFANTKVMDKDSVTQIGSWVKGLVTLVVLLGLTWIFGVLYISRGTIIMAYIFTILNAFQGVFIFIFHCVLNEKVRKAFKRNLKDWSPMPSCLNLRSTSSSSPRGSSTNNNNLLKKRSCSTSVSPDNPLECLYKKIHNRKISTSTQPRSSVVLISQQRTSISYQQSSSDGVVNADASPYHIYSEPTLDDPSAYLDPTLIRLDPEEEMSWSPGYSHMEGSVADTDYLDDMSRPRRNIYTNEPQPNHYRNASLRDGAVSPSSKLDIKKYQLRRNTEGSPMTPYVAEHLNGSSSIASYPKLVVLGRERIGRQTSMA